MARNSTIQWTDHTFNPWHGCTKISPGCANCYAAVHDARRLHEDVDHWGKGSPRMLRRMRAWDEPLRWDRAAHKAGVRRRVFCASLADVFEAEAPRMEQQRLWNLIARTPHLDWQLLTKRPERIMSSIPAVWLDVAPHNVWYGTSVENADYVWRIAEVCKVPAAVRFLSIEPLLGPIPRLPLEGIDWVIVGGESGPGARPMDISWARQVRDQVLARGIPFFFKQWGQHDAAGVRRRSKGEAGRILDGRIWDDFPTPRGSKGKGVS